MNSFTTLIPNQYGTVSSFWVPRHEGLEHNKTTDQLAGQDCNAFGEEGKYSYTAFLLTILKTLSMTVSFTYIFYHSVN